MSSTPTTERHLRDLSGTEFCVAVGCSSRGTYAGINLATRDLDAAFERAASGRRRGGPGTH